MTGHERIHFDRELNGPKQKTRFGGFFVGRHLSFCIWLLIAYTKAKFNDLPAAFLKQLKEEIPDGR